MKEPIDKRTKEYKEYKKWLSSQEVATEDVGVGDVVESITKAIGIKKKKDCGCDDRKKKWNKVKLFKKDLKPRCFTDEEFIEWSRYRGLQEWKTKGLTVTNIDIDFIHKMYQDLFNVKVSVPCLNCSIAPVIHMIDNIDKLYKESK